MTARLPGWEDRLATLVLHRLALPFEWGRNDCVTFAADAIEALTGVDPIASLRGSWRDEESARAAMTRFCGAPVLKRALALMASRYGWKPIHAYQAQRGDLLLDAGRLSVVVGGGCACPGPEGLVLARVPSRASALRV